jgi:beta-xylosidase
MKAKYLARLIASQSMVLLKNDGLLPLDKTIGAIAVIGPNANDGRNQLGDYSYAAMMEHNIQSSPLGSSWAAVDPTMLAPYQVRVTTVLDGIKAVVSSQTKVLYAKGCTNRSDDISGFGEAVNAARQADVVILVLGDKSGLTRDCSCGEFRDSSDISLPGVQANRLWLC